MSSNRRIAWLAVGFALAAAARSSEPGGPLDAAAQATATRVFARCQRAMAEDRCVAAGPSAVVAVNAPLAATVLVAGVGPVAGDIYRQLQQADARMCEVVRAACQRHPAGALCSTASRLW